MIILIIFSFADVEESGKLSLNECLLSHFLMSINRQQSQMFKGNMYWGFNLYLRRYSDVVAPSSQHDRLQIYLLFLLTILVMAAETCDDVFPFSDCSVANYSLLKSM